MRINPPTSLRLDRAALLRDVAERLVAKRPDLAGRVGDHGDPAWMLLEQCAWMVERLSVQLDQYPLAALQSFVAALGAHRHPAVPALGAVVVQPAEAGVLQHPPDRPAPWRFFTVQTETRDMLEFALAELAAPVRPGAFASWCRIEGGELWEVALPAEASGLGALSIRPGAPRRSAAFASERVRWRVPAANAEELKQVFDSAITTLAERRIGWLALRAEVVREDEVAVEAWIDLAAPFRRAAPDGRAPGGDLEADWGTLDDSTWTPPVRITSNTALPPWARGAAPMPGPTEGTALIPGVPPAFPVESLLEPIAAPMPVAVVGAIWSTLINADTRLASLRPTRRRGLAAEAPVVPGWAGAVLQSETWSKLASGGPRHALHLRLSGEGAVRVGLVGRGLGPVEVLPIDEAGGLLAAPLRTREAWALDLPAERGGLSPLVALDVEVPAGVRELLVMAAGALEAALLNPVLVWNAPVAPDGREVDIRRAVPEAVSLLSEDVVTPAVRERLLEQPLPARVNQLLRRLPLACFTPSDGPAIRDYAGVSVDASAGEVVFGAPDPAGVVRELRPGAVVRLDWVRRTDGAAGEVEPGAIRFVEQPPRTRPALVAVTNPLGTFYGAARESEAACRDRLFAPTSGPPVLPGDWEQILRAELGERGRGWVVRCWGHAERNLLSVGLWPPGGDEAAALAEELEHAGPQRLLFVVGPPDRLLSDTELDHARRAAAAAVRRVRDRLPAVEQAIVARLWPLTLEGASTEDLALPCHDLRALRGAVLRDPTGRTAPAPAGTLLLNGAVVGGGGPA